MFLFTIVIPICYIWPATIPGKFRKVWLLVKGDSFWIGNGKWTLNLQLIERNCRFCKIHEAILIDEKIVKAEKIQ
jgi:hypothetical protein